VRTQPCTAAIRRGRLRKAEQFIDAAGTVRDFADGHEDVADAYVTLCVHAGIAASDVICCASLGEHAQGEDHGEAAARQRVRQRVVDLGHRLWAVSGTHRAGPEAVYPPSGHWRACGFRRRRDLSRLRNRVANLVHAVVCYLVPGGFVGEFCA
jgi:hypothetical protein